MSNLVQDVRYAIRLFVKRPGFAAVAILTLALGIGATTAIFTVVNAVLLSPLPFRDAERLVEVRILSKNGEGLPASRRRLPRVAFAEPDLRCRRGAIDGGAATLTGDGAPERIGSAAVTDRFFDVLGAQPLLGRVFQDGDDKPGAPKTVVLSHAFWTRRFHADPAIVGRTVSLMRRQPRRSSA